MDRPVCLQRHFPTTIYTDDSNGSRVGIIIDLQGSLIVMVCPTNSLMGLEIQSGKPENRSVSDFTFPSQAILSQMQQGNEI